MHWPRPCCSKRNSHEHISVSHQPFGQLRCASGLGLLRRTPTTSAPAKEVPLGLLETQPGLEEAENFTKGEAQRPRAAASHHQSSMKDGSLSCSMLRAGAGVKESAIPRTCPDCRSSLKGAVKSNLPIPR